MSNATNKSAGKPAPYFPPQAPGPAAVQVASLKRQTSRSLSVGASARHAARHHSHNCPTVHKAVIIFQPFVLRSDDSVLAQGCFLVRSRQKNRFWFDCKILTGY